ncbi:MAG: flavodoxin family protein [Oscillospiraceae bacterium]|nr:flavodoxin family protein [Oscillospiraceae bacterium]
MKVALINGSPHENGTTAFALGVIAEELSKKDIESEVIHVGRLGLSGCMACGGCAEFRKCILKDSFNEVSEKIHEAQGLVIGSPVYYAGINGTLKAFLDRLFYSGTGKFRFKPAAGIVAMRRAGGTAALQTLNQYFEFAEMLITPTMYWSAVHGLNASEAEQDKEGVWQAQVIGKNMAYLLDVMSKAGSGFPAPEPHRRVKMNFIR